MTPQEENLRKLLAMYRELHSKLAAVNRLLDHAYQQYHDKGGRRA